MSYSTHFISTSIYRKASDLALRSGVAPGSFAHHQEVEEVRENSKYVPIRLLFEVYERGNALIGSDFSVQQGQQLHSDDYGTVGLSWRTAWRAREIIDRLARFMVLITDHGHIRVDEVAGVTRLHLFRDASRRGVEMANEVTFVMLTGILNEVTGKTIRPVHVAFKHPSPGAAPFADFFQCPVQFSQPGYALHFRTADLDIPTMKADKHIHQFLLERMQEEKEGIHKHTDRLLGDIHQLIEDALPSGIPSVMQVADYLGMSARTLKRRLAEKGHTFRELVQQIQRERATTLLRNSTQAIAEIAFQTGFSEQSAFNRAFKRWTGQSPVAFRKNG